jgi:hypothetical protein
MCSDWSFLKYQPMRTHYRPWQPCWISDQHQRHKSCIWPSNEHFCQVWFKSILWFANRKFKMAAMTRLSLTLDPMGISHFRLFFWTHKIDLNQTWQKCSLSHGGHLEFPIGKRFTSLVQDHPMIIPAKSQFNWLSGF